MNLSLYFKIICIQKCWEVLRSNSVAKNTPSKWNVFTKMKSLSNYEVTVIPPMVEF